MRRVVRRLFPRVSSRLLLAILQRAGNRAALSGDCFLDSVILYIAPTMASLIHAVDCYSSTSSSLRYRSRCTLPTLRPCIHCVSANSRIQVSGDLAPHSTNSCLVCHSMLHVAARYIRCARNDHSLTRSYLGSWPGCTLHVYCGLYGTPLPRALCQVTSMTHAPLVLFVLRPSVTCTLAPPGLLPVRIAGQAALLACTAFELSYHVAACTYSWQPFRFST